MRDINEVAKNPDTNSYEFGDMYATENVLIDEFINSPCKTNNIHNATYFLIPIPFTRISQGWDPYNHNVYSDFFGLNLLVDQIAKFLSQQYPIQWKTGNNIFIIAHDFGSLHMQKNIFKVLNQKTRRRRRRRQHHKKKVATTIVMRIIIIIIMVKRKKVYFHIGQRIMIIINVNFHFKYLQLKPIKAIMEKLKYR